MCIGFSNKHGTVANIEPDYEQHFVYILAPPPLLTTYPLSSGVICLYTCCAKQQNQISRCLFIIANTNTHNTSITG